MFVRTTLVIQDTVADIEGLYVPYRPANRLDPEEGHYIEGLKVLVDDTDITERFTDNQLFTFEKELLKYCSSSLELFR